MFPSLFPAAGGYDPLAPLTAPAGGDPPPPIPGLTDQLPTNINAGINSVGRPSDISDLQNDPSIDTGINAAKSDAALRKLKRQAQGDALLAFGASMLGSRTFGEGLGKGLMAYTQSLRSNRPTSKPIGDGEWEEITDPRTGQVTYQPTPIHADKLADRGKPVAAGNHLWQYGTDANGRYNGSVKDLAPPQLEPKTIKDAAGNETVVFVNNDTGEVFDAKGSKVAGPSPASTGAPGVAPAPPPNDPARTPASGGGFAPAFNFVIKHEGTKLNPSDWNGQPVKFGINQQYHPDVANLTLDGAKSIYKSDYWDKSGAASLPPAMQLPYFDTYVRNPTKAQAFLAQSKGNPQAFMALREAWDQAAALKHPGDANGLANRDRDLRAALGSSTAPAAPDASQTGSPADAPAPSAPAPTPTNPWGLQPHDFSNHPPAIHFLSPQERAAAGYPADAVVQRDAKGMDHVMEKGTPTDQKLPDGAILQQAEVFRRTGKMPALGMGNPAVRDQIMSKAAELNLAEGISGGDIPAAQADYNNDVAARSDRNKQLTVIRPSLNAAIQHGNDALRLAAQIPAQTNVKLWNYVSQGILDQNSNPTLYAFQGAAKLAEAEVAKAITGNPNSGAGQLTDEARKEFRILEGPAGVPAKKKAWDTLVTMMHQKYQAVQDEIGTIDQRMHGPLNGYVKGTGNSASAPQGKPTIVRSGTAKDGRRVVQYSDGTYAYGN